MLLPGPPGSGVWVTSETLENLYRIGGFMGTTGKLLAGFYVQRAWYAVGYLHRCTPFCNKAMSYVIGLER